VTSGLRKGRQAGLEDLVESHHPLAVSLEDRKEAGSGESPVFGEIAKVVGKRGARPERELPGRGRADR
jgi:hypothetical protein